MYTKLNLDIHMYKNTMSYMTGSIIHCRVVMNTLLASYSAHTHMHTHTINTYYHASCYGFTSLKKQTRMGDTVN